MGYGEYHREKYAGSNRKPWWEEELDLIDRWDEKEYEGRSVSSTRDFLGHYGWGERSYGGGNDIHGKLNKVSADIARLMNTVLNSEKGKQERTLSIAWSAKSDATQNNPKSDAVTLSPDLVVGKTGSEDKSKDPAVVDGIGGQVLMGSTLKRTMSMRAFSAAQEDGSPVAKHNRAIWEAAETAKAKQALLSEWPGFAPYLKRHQALTSSEQEQVQAFIDSKPDKLSAAVAATAWTVANPRQPLTLTPKMGDAVRQVAERLDEASSFSRYMASTNAVDYLRTIFEEDDADQKQQPQPDPQGQQGDSQGQGQPDPNQQQGKGDQKPEDKKGSGQQQPSPTPPQVTDSTLFGGGVPSSHSDVPTPFKATEDPTNREHPDHPGDAQVFKKVRYVDMSYSAKQESQRYPALVKAGAHITRAIVASIQFRRTAPEFPLHGLLSGDLDDGSLDKLALRDPRPAVFERKEITAIPDVAILLLVDESGSMSGRKMDAARIVCTAMREAFCKLRGLNVMVLGYSQSENSYGIVDIYNHLSNRSQPSLGSMNAHDLTPTGTALEEGLKRLANDYPRSKQKYCFVLTDGNPNGVGVSGRTEDAAHARPRVRRVVEWGRKRFGINTYGIGLCGQPCEAHGIQMYGRGQFVTLPDVTSSARVIASFLSRVTART